MRDKSPPSGNRMRKLSLLAVIALAAILTLWGLSKNGYSNEYYAAAVKSASVDLKAWFFGSLDPGNFITVDKPPLSIWLMGLSSRIFGFGSFSMLLPQAICTIASVGILYSTVKRLSGHTAGIIAALALATTPITVAIARVNNPDALMILLMVAAAYATVRAIESGKTGHLLLGGALVGLAFMTKMLQGWMVAPSLALAYLVAAQVSVPKRIKQLLLTGVVMTATSVAWPLAASIWPGSKPYIGGSDDGGVWDLILGYNGFGRIFGEGAGGGMGGSFGGTAGLFRMFNSQVGAQIAWLIPAALMGGLALAYALLHQRKQAKKSQDTELEDQPHRVLVAHSSRALLAGLALFGSWAAIHFLIFSFQKGIFHPYYTSAMAPALAALVGMGALASWKLAGKNLVGNVLLVAGIAGSSLMAFSLLGRASDYLPWLRYLVLAAAAVAILAMIITHGTTPKRWLGPTVATAAAVAVLAGPAAFSFANLNRSLDGNNVLAGPASVTSNSMGGGPGGMGGNSTDTALISYLLKNQGDAKYLVAANGARSTQGIIIATGKAVVTIGGFSGSDDAPTLEQFKELVSSGQLKYVLVSSGGMGGPGGGNSAITSWVTSNGKAVSGVSSSSGTLYEVGS